MCKIETEKEKERERERERGRGRTYTITPPTHKYQKMKKKTKNEQYREEQQAYLHINWSPQMFVNKKNNGNEQKHRNFNEQGRKEILKKYV